MKFRVDLSKVRLTLTAIGYYLKTLPPYERKLRTLPPDTDVKVDIFFVTKNGLQLRKEEAIIEVPLKEYRKRKLYLFDKRNPIFK